MTEPRLIDIPGGSTPADRIAALVAWLASMLVVVVFAWILVDLLRRGLPHLSIAFLIQRPLDAGRAGGIVPVIVSTILILAVCLITSLPVALITAIFLSEFGQRQPRIAAGFRHILDVLAGVPSIVFGLFGNAFFSIWLGMGFSILSGGLTLACMTLPIMTRSIEEALRAVGDAHRRTGAALGLTKWAVLWRIVLPVALPGIAAGTALGVGRALAETAALLFTSGYVTRMPGSLLDSGRALSVHVYDLAMNVPGGGERAAAAALLLVLMLMVINLMTTWLARLGGHWSGTNA